MVAIPKRTGTVPLIDSMKYGGEPRPYLGMSGIGDACWRKLWYGFHWVYVEKHTARSERIFDIGHLFEAMAICDLKKAGCFVFRVDEDGNQVELTGEVGEEQEEFVGFAGHVKGHNDGRILGLQEMPDTVCNLELKTMKDDKFNSFKTKGIRVSHPKYYAQSQRYMLEMNLTWTFLLAINKNTAEYWWEFFELDREFAGELERKEKVIIISDEPPEKGYSSDNYNCNFCNYYAICHSVGKVDTNCRTCDHCDLEDGGKWSCALQDEKILSVEEQRAGCDKWEIGWGLKR